MTDIARLLRDIQFLHDLSVTETTSDLNKEEDAAVKQLLKTDLEGKITKLQELSIGGLSESVDAVLKIDNSNEAEEFNEMVVAIGVPDSVLVVAARQELTAVRELFSEMGCPYKDIFFNSVPGRVYAVRSNDGEQINLGLLAASGQRVDPMKSIISSLAGSDDLNLDSIIMVGMMGGFPQKSNLLEVILPSQIYDGRHFSVGNNGFKKEPGPAPRTNAKILDVAANLPELSLDGHRIPVRTHKTTITISGKWDTLSNDLVEEVRSVDEENAVGVEQEGSAISEVCADLERAKLSVPIAMIKGVADYCSIGSNLSEAEIKKVYKEASLNISTHVDIDPSGSQFKPILQSVATKRAAIVAIEIAKILAKGRA